MKKRRTNKLIYYTDGACNNEKRIGAWAYVCVMIKNNEERIKKKNFCGVYQDATPNKAELSAVVNALRDATYQCNHNKINIVEIVTDSKYVVRGCKKLLPDINQSNLFLWKQFDLIIEQLEKSRIIVDINWTPGHEGNVLNEEVDRIAKLWLRRMEETNHGEKR